MNRLLLLAVALSASISATGCIPFAGCGGYAGAKDMVYQRGSDMMIVCTNGGYSATLGTVTQEGRASSTELTDGPTGAIASDYAVSQTDGTPTAFGGTWTYVPLDQTGLDHADTLCTDLETRAWWTAPTLPVNTKFARAAGGFITVDDCIAAQAAGGYSATAACQDELDLCADGSVIETLASGTVTGSYTVSVSELSISTFAGTSTLRPDGILLVQNETAWSTKAVSPQAVSKCAK